MEFDTTRASFSFNAKSAELNEDIRRGKIVDPGSPELVVNALSRGAASNSYALNHGLEDVAWPSMTAPYGHANTLDLLPLMNPLQGVFGELPDPLPSPRTNAWMPIDTNFRNDQMLNESNLAADIHATVDTLRSLASSPPENYPLDGGSPSSLYMSSEAYLSQARLSANPGFASPIDHSLENMFFAPGNSHSYTGDETFQFWRPGSSTLPSQYPSNQGILHSPHQQAFHEHFAPLFDANTTFGPTSSKSSRGTVFTPPQKSQSKPPTVVNLPQAALAVSSLLPPQDSLMASFNTRPNPPASKRLRKSFTKVKKKKVHDVRKHGACVRCHDRKLPCSIGEVCERCQNLADNDVMAHHICVRTKFKDNYMGVKNLHQSLYSRNESFEPLISSMTGLPIPIQLCVMSEYGRVLDIDPLVFQVMRCTFSPSCRWRRLEMLNGIYVTSAKKEDERYVIVPASLPSIDDFDKFGRKFLTQDRSHSGAITWNLDNFLSIYCSRTLPSRLRRLVSLTLRIASFNKLVAYGFVNLSHGCFDLLRRPDGGDYNQRFVCESLHDQIRLLAVKGLEPAEELISSELDDLESIAGTSKHARILAGVCVLRLVFIYRDRWVRDEIRMSLPKNSNRHQPRLDKAASFYKRLTLAYSTLCRGKKTPLTADWEDEDDYKASEQSKELKDAFSKLQPAFQIFCETKLERQHDDVFTKLIASPMMNQEQRKRQKTAR